MLRPSGATPTRCPFTRYSVHSMLRPPETPGPLFRHCHHHDVVITISATVPTPPRPVFWLLSRLRLSAIDVKSAISENLSSKAYRERAHRPQLSASSHQRCDSSVLFASHARIRSRASARLLNGTASLSVGSVSLLEIFPRFGRAEKDCSTFDWPKSLRVSICVRSGAVRIGRIVYTSELLRV